MIIPGIRHSIPARLYQPSDDPAGLIVYYHGGGWVVGSIESTDAALRLLANETNCSIISVDYRLAPQHKFPAAVEDAITAFEWAANKRTKLAGSAGIPVIVMGDSAGGNLAAVVAQHANNTAGPKISLQVLIYPVTEGETDSEAMRAFTPPFLTRENMSWFVNHYIPSDQRADPRFAPGKAKNLYGLPPAIILTAEYDLLTAEAKLYGEKLRAAGVNVTHLDYPGAIHGFFTMATMLEIGRKAIQETADCIKAAVASNCSPG